MEIFKQTISPNIFKEPCMKKLHGELLELLAPLNSSFQTNTKMKACMNNLTESRKNLVEVVVLYQLISHCISSSGMDLKHCRASSKILSDFRNLIMTCQFEQLFVTSTPQDDNGDTLLDIDTAILVDEAKDGISAQHRIALLSMLKSYLACSCEKIVQFTFPSESFAVSNGMVEVTKYIVTLTEQTDESRVLLAKQKEHNALLTARLFKEMAEYAEQLEYIVSNYRFSKHSLLHLQCLSVSLKAHWLKLRCLELDVLCKTYTRDSVPVLIKIDRRLSERISLAEDSLASVRNQLSKYDRLDARFQALLKEHSCLQKDLQFFYDGNQS